MKSSSAEKIDDDSGNDKLPKPFVKWAGGKGQLVPELLKRVPSKFRTYYEPFAGGSALFFRLRPERSYISDINRDLINCFSVVKSNLGPLIKELKKHRYDEKYYYQIRDVDREEEYKNWDRIQKAARLIYLNKSCYNGLYRVNSKGHFNTPFGRYTDPKLVDEENLHA